MAWLRKALEVDPAQFEQLESRLTQMQRLQTMSTELSALVDSLAQADQDELLSGFKFSESTIKNLKTQLQSASKQMQPGIDTINMLMERFLKKPKAKPPEQLALPGLESVVAPDTTVKDQAPVAVAEPNVAVSSSLQVEAKMSPEAQKWISHKIEYLISKEKKPRRQAEAIAYSMAKKKFHSVPKK